MAKPSVDSLFAMWRELTPTEQMALVCSDNRPGLKQFLRDAKSPPPSDWTVEIDDKGGYQILNRGSDGVLRFYSVGPGKYGEPILTPEPDLAFPAPANLTYINAKGETVVPTERISGIICKDGPRFSLTNAKMKGVNVEVNDDGSILIDGETWYIATLFSKDRNRVRNYDAYLVRVRPEHTRMLELGDLDLF